MKREILFRGKRADNGEWVFGDILHNLDAVKIREQEKTFCGIAKSFRVEPDTVGQYTGLKDKRNKKIFEGDIIKLFNDRTGNIYTSLVCFGECGGVRNSKRYGYTGFYFRAYDDEMMSSAWFGLRDDPIYWLSVYAGEVIGNVHDDSEKEDCHEKADN